MRTRVDRLVLGTAPLGGLFSSVDADIARATLERAWQLGVRAFDTAPLYGSGLAEQRLGSALRERPRDAFWVSTKVGRLLRGGRPDPIYHGVPDLAPSPDYSAGGVRRSLDESFERLGLDRIDAVLIHDPEAHMGEALAAVETLADGRRLVGVGTNYVETALTFAREAPIDCVLLAGRYTLLDRTGEPELLALCAERGIDVLAAAVFNSGILAGGSTFDYRAARPELLARVRALEACCARHDVPLAAAALQFPLRHPAVSRIVVGMRSPVEVETNLEHLALPVPDELWNELAERSVGP